MADAHLKRDVARTVARDGPRRAAVVVLINGRLDGSTASIERSTEGFDRAQPRASRRGLAEVFGTWERIFQGQAEPLTRESDDRRRKRVLVKIIGE